MTKRFLQAGVLAMAMVVSCFADDKTENLPSAQSLINLAPRIALEEESVKSFKVHGAFDFGGIKLKFVVLGKQPEQVSVRIFDARDSTVILAGSTNGFALYDPVASETVLGDAVPSFTLELEADKSGAGEPPNLTLGFGVYTKGSGNGDDPSETIIDIKSLLKMLTSELAVSVGKNGQFVLQGKTGRGNRAVAFVKPGRRLGAYTRVELYQVGKNEAFMVFDDIEINGEVSDRDLVFPRDKIMQSELKTRVLNADTFYNSAMLMGRLLRGVMARMVIGGVDNEELRKAVQNTTLQKLDWDKMRQADAKASVILRRLLVPEPRAESDRK